MRPRFTWDTRPLRGQPGLFTAAAIGQATLLLSLHRGFLVLRVGPLVLQVKDPSRHPLLFSQRGRGVRLGRWWLSGGML